MDAHIGRSTRSMAWSEMNSLTWNYHFKSNEIKFNSSEWKAACEINNDNKQQWKSRAHLSVLSNWCSWVPRRQTDSDLHAIHVVNDFICVLQFSKTAKTQKHHWRGRTLGATAYRLWLWSKDCDIPIANDKEIRWKGVRINQSINHDF